MFANRFAFDPMRGTPISTGTPFLRPNAFTSAPFYSPISPTLNTSSNALAALEVMRSKTDYTVKKKVGIRNIRF